MTMRSLHCRLLVRIANEAAMKPIRECMRVAISIVLIIWVFLIIANNIQRLVHSEATNEKTTVSANIQESLIVGHAPILGSSTASIKIIEFSDFQCPYCRLADPVLVKFIARHPGDAVVFRIDLPLVQVHHYAYAASVAAKCAEMQGIREPYQSLLFQHQKEFATLNWVALAKQGGVEDTRAFEQCIIEEKPRDRILKDIKAAESLGIDGTPSFIINGKLYTDGLTEEMLESLYKEMDRKQHGFLHSLFNM